jgi:hypothetical protein
MNDVQSWPHSVVTAEYGVPQRLASQRTQEDIIAYRRLVATILGVDIATLTRELRKRRIETHNTQKAA